MEGTVTVGQGMAHRSDGFVIRRFSPVRIERLLLTRLFDLTTGRIPADSDEGPGTLLATGIPTETSAGGRKEAA